MAGQYKATIVTVITLIITMGFITFGSILRNEFIEIQQNPSSYPLSESISQPVDNSDKSESINKNENSLTEPKVEGIINNTPQKPSIDIQTAPSPDTTQTLVEPEMVSKLPNTPPIAWFGVDSNNSLSHYRPMCGGGWEIRYSAHSRDEEDGGISLYSENNHMQEWYKEVNGTRVFLGNGHSVLLPYNCINYEPYTIIYKITDSQGLSTEIALNDVASPNSCYQANNYHGCGSTEFWDPLLPSSNPPRIIPIPDHYYQ